MFSFKTPTAVIMATLTLVSAADRFQDLGNELGRAQSSVGELRHANTANAYQLASAAAAYDAVLATSIPELRRTGFENLSPEAARQHALHIEQYVNELLKDNAQLHDEARNVAAREQQSRPEHNYQAQAAYQAQAIRPNAFQAATGVPAFKNKAVVKAETTTTTSTPSSSDAASATSTTTTENLKSESKESKSEAKTESKEEKSESKSESKASKKSEHAAAANGTTTASSTHGAAASGNTTTATSTRTKGHKSKNGAAAYGMTGGALVAGAVLALL